ncbi:mannan endo-1,4-beta-mannosidase [Kaistella treverensis]|uniref:Mannan endo-1,4-beta-mannosidase n=1 Tax=Kaistella treverensis TaxID=631455 RepID=A0A1I3LH60_9FLAO|nr:mannan endo-1,4-beta-mannosidase [Kaistella treverensis]
MRRIYQILFLIFAFSMFSCSRNGTENNENSNTPVVAGITPQNVKTFMVDKNATTETAALFYNLYKNAGSKILVGHQDAFYSYYQNDASMSDVKKTIGSDPAMIGLDFMFITDKNYQANSSNWYYQQEQKIIAAAKEAYNKGMAVTFCWHLREPFQETDFYTTNMTDEQKQNAFKSILPNGAKHNWYKLKLDKVASVFNNLIGNDGKKIPVIFRPFHEFDGNWFWWGANYCTADEYNQAYQFTVSYLRDTKGVHNVLYAFSPDASYNNSVSYLQRYPGDSYVDILGMDNYIDFYNQNSAGVTLANQKLQMISDLAVQKNKIAALTETGYSSSNTTPRTAAHFTDLVFPAITNNNIKISYINFWSNYQDNYFVPTPATPYATDFKNFTLKPKMTLQNNIGTSLYVLQ